MRTINIADTYADDRQIVNSLKTAGAIGYATMAVSMGANIARMAGYDTGLTNVTDIFGPFGTGLAATAIAFPFLRRD